ncbi:hypothetical protein CC86DRAFT_366900 [Ophiobolus disseminans]|uniref:Uncharacterized protein n=1 Tax=Ophiobolus disseminans TaxID=1469910 RepID=A0A6A7AF91_9PLEO|nr:hypothetical protein CC86DRAFT_366900 [Ophiobolus disseminans]
MPSLRPHPPNTSIRTRHFYMPESAESEWTIIDPTFTTTEAQAMAATNDTTAAPAEPKIELSMNPKPIPAEAPVDQKEEKESPTCTCDASMPKLERQDSIESLISVDDDYRRAPRRVYPNYNRNYSPSPIRRRAPGVRVAPALFDKSSHFLESVGKFDGTVDLPCPSRGAVYLTTYPFTEKDVKKWAWLFSLNVEDTFLEEASRGRRGRAGEFDNNGDDVTYSTVRRARNEFPIYDAMTIDIPSVYLSRALDLEVVPEDTANVSYLIVTQNRHRLAGSKLLVAESRKAAGIMMYYEALKGDSTVFVGAVLDYGEKKVHPKKFKKVGSLEEAIKVKEEDFVGIIC